MKRWALVLGLVGLIVACGGDSSGSDTTTTTLPPTTTTTTLPPTTTTTTLPPTTTTTTLPPTPAELRDEYLTSLDDLGWQTYVDETVGWSLRVPGDWIIDLDTDLGGAVFHAPSGAGAVSVTPALDAATDDEGSLDYLEGNVDFAVKQGTLREPLDSDWFWLDSDFDDLESLFDVRGVQLSFAVNPVDGSELSDDTIAPTWWYGYYDPTDRPAYGYVMVSLGTSTDLFSNLDLIALSFEPPGGFPTSE